MKPQIFFKALPLVLMSGSGVPGSLALAEANWLQHDQPFSVGPVEAVAPGSTLRFLVGNQDLTALFHQTTSDTYRYQASAYPLAAGEHELVIYAVNAQGDWEEVLRDQINVLTPSGFELSDVQVTASLAINSQLDSGGHQDGVNTESETYNHLTGQLSLSTQHQVAEKRLSSEFNFSGSSDREQALRFDRRESQAPKVDLSDYLVSYDQGNLNLSLGHVSYGQHPLLMADINHRGVSAKYRINSFLDVSGTVQNGSSITGGANLLGLKDSQHRILASTLGVELLPEEPGKLRVEITHLNASRLPIDDFGVGEVSDAEESTGWGLRLLSESWDGRLRVDGSMAWNRYTNPEDVELSQGDELVKTESSRDQAYQASIEADLLQSDMDAALPTSLTIRFDAERIDPLYQSLTAFPTADNQLRGITLTGQLGLLDWQVLAQNSEDNLDNIATILKTKTEIRQASLNTSLSEWFEAAEHTHWYPDLSLTYEQTHQYAGNDPDPELSDFNGGSHLPDQNNRSAQLSLNWNFDRWSLSYSYTDSDIDNRQTGRETADFETRDHQLTLAFMPLDTLNLELSAGRNETQDIELNDTTRSNFYGVNLNWQLPHDFQMDLSYTDSYDRTRSNIASSDNEDLSLGLTQSFQAGQVGLPLNGQWFIRYARNDSHSVDNSFDTQSESEDWRITAGISLEF